MALLTSPRRGFDWFVDGLAEALLWVQNRRRGKPVTRVEMADGTTRVVAADGSAIGHIVGAAPARFEPPDLARRLAGAVVDIHIPPAWVFRRELEPVAAQSAPYLDAFVRHQIDRITPWRVADVHYKTVLAPIPGDPTRLSVEIGVVPKRLVQSCVDAISAANPSEVRLVAREPSGSLSSISVSNQSLQGMPGLRRRVRISLAALGLGFVAVIAGAWWYAGTVRSEIADQDQVIEQRNAVLAASLRRAKASTATEEALRALRDSSRPRAVDVIDALSAALPDSAYLTTLAVQKDQIQISGVTQNIPELVPALETSGRFKDVGVTAAMTRMETGTGDRFHLQLRADAHAEAAKP